MLVKQLGDDFAQYLYLPRLKNQQVLIESINQGISLLTWAEDGFAYAQDFDADRNRYIGLVGGQSTQITADHTSLVVKPDIASAQLKTVVGETGTEGDGTLGGRGVQGSDDDTEQVDDIPQRPETGPKRFYGSVRLDATRLGRDAGRVAEEVLGHLAGLSGAKANITLDIEVTIPDGVPENVVRTVTENCRTLKFKSQGFEQE